MDIADGLSQSQFLLSSVASYTAEVGELKSTFPLFLDVILCSANQMPLHK